MDTQGRKHTPSWLTATVAVGLICAAPSYAASVSPPAEGAYLGGYAQFGSQEDSVTKAKLDFFEAIAGQELAWVRFSSYWGRKKFPTRQAKLIQSRGALPDIHWAPWPRFDVGRSFKRYRLQRIIDGDWDGYIKRWLKAARSYGGPLLVEFGVEMNGNWFRNWSGLYNGAGRKSGFGSPRLADGPERYVAAYRRIITMARRLGASKISFGFHVNAPSYPDRSWNRFASYYPGSNYIDWVGMSAYGAQRCDEEWLIPDEIIGPAYEELRRMAPAKPIYIGEGGIAECPKLGSKPEWIESFLSSAQDRYPKIKAVNWWSERWRNEDGSISNLRIDSSAEALAAFKLEAGDPYWRHSYP